MNYRTKGNACQPGKQEHPHKLYLEYKYNWVHLSYLQTGDILTYHQRSAKKTKRQKKNRKIETLATYCLKKEKQQVSSTDIGIEKSRAMMKENVYQNKWKVQCQWTLRALFLPCTWTHRQELDLWEAAWGFCASICTHHSYLTFRAFSALLCRVSTLEKEEIKSESPSQR